MEPEGEQDLDPRDEIIRLQKALLQEKDKSGALQREAAGAINREREAKDALQREAAEAINRERAAKDALQREAKEEMHRECNKTIEKERQRHHDEVMAFAKMGTEILQTARDSKRRWSGGMKSVQDGVKELESTRAMTSVRSYGKQRGYAVAVKQGKDGDATIRIVSGFREEVDSKMEVLGGEGFHRIVYPYRAEYFNPSSNVEDFIDNVVQNGDQYLDEALEDQALPEASPVNFELMPTLHIKRNPVVLIRHVVEDFARVQFETSEKSAVRESKELIEAGNDAFENAQWHLETAAIRLQDMPVEDGIKALAIMPARKKAGTFVFDVSGLMKLK